MSHAARSHATWAASSSARYIHCAGALALESSLPAEVKTSSYYAAEGTAMHQIAERMLRTGANASELVGETEIADGQAIFIDDELAYAIDQHLEFCRGLAEIADQTWTEQRFDLGKLKLPFETGGTSDFIAWIAAQEEIVVVDLKGGRGVVVEVAGNAQMRVYALGVLLNISGLKVKRIRVVVVQPRASHPDGIVRSETFDVADLMEWAADLMVAQQRASEALDSFAQAQTNSVDRDDWVKTWLRPGACQFCPAYGACPALRNDALSTVDDWFDADTERLNLPMDNSPEQIADDLNKIEAILDWANARRTLGQQLAEAGVDIPGWMLSPKRKTRKWIEENEIQNAMSIAEATGLKADQLYNRKLKSPAQVEKLLPRRKEKIEHLIKAESSGNNLVRRGRSTRGEAVPMIDRFMEPVETETGQSEKDSAHG